MGTEDWVKLKRDIEAIQIPDGNKIKVDAGTDVKVTQSLGGTFTVMTSFGYLVRVESKDADALGKTAAHADPKKKATDQNQSVEDQIWAQLKTCYDPEIPVNIVDLGLVYVCKVTPTPEQGYSVEIKFTLTAPGCGMGDVLKVDIETKLATIPRIQSTHVEIVFEPAWDRSMMSEAAKLQLGML